MSTREVGIEEGRAKLGDLVIDAQRGTPARITRNGKPAAILLPSLDDDLLEQISAWAGDEGLTFAEALRGLLREAIAAARPYTLTIRDISTGVRETRTRHGSLGAAVEALRDFQAYDNENNGLPSYLPRVEHDGRPVDVEAVQ